MLVVFREMIEYNDIEFDVNGTFEPGYEPYPTSNPNSPLFSDPGSDPEIVDLEILHGEDDFTPFLTPKAIEDITDILIERLSFYTKLDYDYKEEQDGNKSF